MKKFLVINLAKPITQLECARAYFENNVHFTRSHDCFELFLITDGELFLKHGDDDVYLKAGDVYFSQPMVKYGGTQPSTCSFYWLHFTADDYYLCDEYPDEIKLNKDILVIPLQFNVKDFSNLVVTFSLLSQQVLLEHSSLSQKIRDSYLTAILSELALIYDKPKKESTPNNRLLQIVEYLMTSANLQEFKSVKEMAEFFGYNEKYLIRLFRSHLNISPLQFLTDRKIVRAKEMLVKPELTVENIALSLGYDYQYFLKLFKKKVGLTPTEFRNAVCPDWQLWMKSKK